MCVCLVLNTQACLCLTCVFRHTLPPDKQALVSANASGSRESVRVNKSSGTIVTSLHETVDHQSDSHRLLVSRPPSLATTHFSASASHRETLQNSAFAAARVPLTLRVTSASDVVIVRVREDQSGCSHDRKDSRSRNLIDSILRSLRHL